MQPFGAWRFKHREDDAMVHQNSLIILTKQFLEHLFTFTPTTLWSAFTKNYGQIHHAFFMEKLTITGQYSIAMAV